MSTWFFGLVVAMAMFSNLVPRADFVRFRFDFTDQCSQGGTLSDALGTRLVFSSISSVNIARSSFILVTKLSLNEQEEKKNFPQKLKFQYFDLMMISFSNFRSNFRKLSKTYIT